MILTVLFPSQQARGNVPGEGGAILLVEEAEAARARGARLRPYRRYAATLTHHLDRDVLRIRADDGTCDSDAAELPGHRRGLRRRRWGKERRPAEASHSFTAGPRESR